MANEDDIDYTAEGATPPHEKDDPTAEGYDEAAHRGAAYGVREGSGGVFGTTGGGSFPEGMHIEERPVVETTEPASAPDDSSGRGSNRGR